MTRMYIQPSWIDAASDHNQWSGGNGQYRGDKSADIATFDKQGRARVGAFSDEAIEARKPKKSSVPLKQRILPQAARVERHTAQMIELCAEYKAGLHSQEEYTLLLSVVSAKRARAEELLAKAVSVKAPFEREEEAVSSVNNTLPRQILSENKRSALKAKHIKVKTEDVKHDRKSLSKVADWINRNSFIYFIGCSTIALTAAKIIF